MTRSLFPDDDKKRDRGIGGLAPQDALSRSEQSALRSLGADELDTRAEHTSAPAYTPSAPRTSSSAQGGTGRAAQRGPQYANVFTMAKGNSKYLTGERDKPVSNMWGSAIGLIAMIAFIGFFFFITNTQTSSRSSSSTPPAIFFLFFAAFGLFWIFSAVREWRRYTYFVTNGQLLIGEVVNANGQWVWTGSGKSRSRKYQVTVNYRLRTPDGQTIDGKESAYRNDLARQSLPEPGAQIAALYVPTDQQTRLL